MGDYLSNLAARALGLAPVAQPRPASLFEPPRLPGGPAWGEIQAEAEASGMAGSAAAAADRLRAPAPGLRAAREPGARDFERSEEQDARARPALQPAESVLEEAAAPSSSVQPRAPEPLAESQPEAARPSPFPPAGPTEPATVLDNPQVRVLHPRTPRDGGQEGAFRFDPGSLLVPERGLVYLEPDSAAEAVAASRAASAPQASGPASSPGIPIWGSVQPPLQGNEPGMQEPMGSSALEPRLLAVPRVALSVQAAAPSEGVSQPAGAAPVIHVTIGRIEVRAVQPAPAAPAPRVLPPSPPMSLDDYLRRPIGGKR